MIDLQGIDHRKLFKHYDWQKFHSIYDNLIMQEGHTTKGIASMIWEKEHKEFMVYKSWAQAQMHILNIKIKVLEDE